MLYLQELKLIVFFLMELSDRFFLEVHFLNVLVLVISFFIEKLLDLVRQRSIFRFKLPHLNLERLIIFKDCELCGWCYSRSRFGGIARVGLGSLTDCGFGLFLRGVVLIHNF